MRFDWRTFPELGADLLYDVLALRQRVFVVEQACAYLDADGADRDAIHLIGWEDRAIAGYLRVLPPSEDGAPRIGRVVTAPEHRDVGLARPLMREGMRGVFLRYPAARAIRIEAQAHLSRLYASLGFEVIGEAYDEDGIPHVPMRLDRPARP